MILNPSRKIIFHYMRKRMQFGCLRSAWYTYLNHCLFAQVVIDKFAMYAGKRFEVKVVGYDAYLRLLEKPDAFVQLSSHIGNYEIAGYSLKADKKAFNALVYWGEKESVMKNRMFLFKDTHIRMIPVSPDMSHLFDINAALSKGEVVSIPADRIWGSPKKLVKYFLGGEASFPYGPFSIATMRSLDVVAVNVMKTAAKQYTIYITPLLYNKEANGKARIEELSDAYVKELEKMLGLYPTQWYNYFDFWHE
ncbi:lipid A biosynthesis acyltransferase [Bacteroides sp. An269]|uniref:LpxL/LpxP family acyltransferase n=1 Tax=Bacteroides TaxID=816 RepID=UPI0031BB77FD